MDVKVGQRLSDFEAMSLAIQQAYLSAAFVSPNPLVGSVVLDRNNNLLSFGRHEIYGGPHAEVNAVRGLSSEQLSGARVFVTLEPCAHEGKTPSCAKMLAKLPISEVVYGLIDPNPLVAGQGAQILTEAGIQVVNYSEVNAGTEQDLTSSLEEVCEVFLFNFRKKKPFVAMKVAQSLDGQVALANGESKWITGPEAREHGHQLRANYDLTLVGVGTVLSDNPSLNVRLKTLSKENAVAILDSKARLLSNLSNLNLVKTHSAEKIFWLIGEGILKNEELLNVRQFVTPVFIKLTNGRIDLDDGLGKLWDLGIRSILVEAGPTLTSSFLQKNILQKLFVFVAPKLLGAGKSWSKDLQVSKITDALILQNLKTQALGPDILIVGSVKH